MPLRELYGGHMVADFPPSYTDASDLRQVPDHQEVWVDMDSDSSIIIELLDVSSEVQASEIGPHHFDEISKANDSQESRVIEERVLGPEEGPLVDAPGLEPGTAVVKGLCHGTQRIAKYKEDATNLVSVTVCCLRVPLPHDTEILITHNAPITIAPESSSAELPGGEVAPDASREVFDKFLSTFKVNDWSIFHPQ